MSNNYYTYVVPIVSCWENQSFPWGTKSYYRVHLRRL